DPVSSAKVQDAVKAERAEKQGLVKRVRVLESALERARQAPKAPILKRKRSSSSRPIVRVVVPDSHGAHIHWPAAHAMLQDFATLDPDECVLLGDHLDCAGTFSTHQRCYTNELTESYAEDCRQANAFLDGLQTAMPHCRAVHY